MRARVEKEAQELPCIVGEEQVIDLVRECLRFYKDRSWGGERFSRILRAGDIEDLARRRCTDAV